MASCSRWTGYRKEYSGVKEGTLLACCDTQEPYPRRDKARANFFYFLALPMAHSYRRVVTTNDANGHSVVAQDIRIESGPLSIVDFWKTSAVPASLAEDRDAVSAPNGLAPPESGTAFTFFEIPPRNPSISSEQLERAASEAFSAAGANHYRVDTRRDPMMHTTPTIDYVVLLRGQGITMLLDEEEVPLKPFDAVVQRATNHTWINHGDEAALFMSVLLPAN